jgi:hypothetical protein
MTARHALTGDRGIKVCDHDEACAALVWADGPLAGRDVDHDHTARHAAHIIPAYPYGPVYVHGVRAWPDDDITDEELRSCHSTRFPITGGLYDGYPLGGRR